ncbi:MAG: hypothetical protein ABIQ39_06470 [Ilumatobacteraceae bacterium]
MLLNVGAVWRRSDITTEEFRTIWAEQYAPLMLAQEQISFYGQCLIDGVEGGSLDGFDTPPDGLAIVGFEDKAARASLSTSKAITEEAPALRELFCDRTVGLLSVVELLGAIEAEGLATLARSLPVIPPDAELIGRSLGDQPVFGAIVLHSTAINSNAPAVGGTAPDDESDWAGITLRCTRLVMRPHAAI